MGINFFSVKCTQQCKDLTHAHCEESTSNMCLSLSTAIERNATIPHACLSDDGLLTQGLSTHSSHFLAMPFPTSSHPTFWLFQDSGQWSHPRVASTSICIVHVSHCCDKTPNRRDLRRKGLFWLAGQGISPSWQGDTAAGHTVSMVKKQREVSAGGQLTFSFLLHPKIADL